MARRIAGDTDGFVVVFDCREEYDIFVDQCVCNSLQELRVFFRVLASADYQRNIDRFFNCFGSRDTFFNGAVRAVGICACKRQVDEISRRVVLYEFRPAGSVVQEFFAVDLFEQGFPVFRLRVGDFDPYRGSVAGFRQERQIFFTAELDGLVSGPDYDLFDLAGIFGCCFLKCHVSSS